MALIFFRKTDTIATQKEGEAVMTLKEAEKKFGLPRSVLEEYVSYGLIRESGVPEGYRDADFERLGLIDTLFGAGFTPEETKRYLLLMESGGTDAQQVCMLKKRRRAVLDDIHKKQHILDSLDYMIWTKRNSGAVSRV